MFIKYFKTMLSFFLKLFGEKRFVNSVKVFLLNIKSINPIQKYQHTIESYACILKMLVFMFFIPDKFFNFFRNMFHSKTIKISNIIITYPQSNPMSSNIRVLVKIYYISPILYFWLIISSINTIKSRFILIFLDFKIG